MESAHIGSSGGKEGVEVKGLPDPFGPMTAMKGRRGPIRTEPL